MKVLVTGSLGYDFIMDFSGCFADRIMPDKIHSISLSFLADKLNKQFGGTAGNIAYTLKLLGTDPRILSSAGNDFAPYKKFLKTNKISTTGIPEVKNLPSSTYFVITDRDDNQIGSFYVGAMKNNQNLSIAKDKYELVIISPNDPVAMQKYVSQCHKQGLKYLYDPAFQTETFTASELDEGISGAEIVIGNDYEISLMEHKLGISHEELLLKTHILVTTIGSKGSIIENTKDQIYIKPAKVKNVSDPTGAGDAYRGGFVAGYVRGFDISVCGQMGSVAAAYTVEKYGTVTHTYTIKQFMDRFYENFGSRIKLN